MPPAKTPGLTYQDWNQIQNRISSLIAQSGESFIQAAVIKSDPVKKLVWIAELGTIPIPLIAFDYEATIYDTLSDGSVRTYTVICKPKTPVKGDDVLIALHLGSRRLPKCLGKIQSKGWVED